MTFRYSVITASWIALSLTLDHANSGEIEDNPSFVQIEAHFVSGGRPVPIAAPSLVPVNQITLISGEVSIPLSGNTSVRIALPRLDPKVEGRCSNPPTAKCVEEVQKRRFETFLKEVETRADGTNGVRIVLQSIPITAKEPSGCAWTTEGDYSLVCRFHSSSAQ